VYVFGDYTRYIPYYVYSVLKSYPDYYVKVFTKDSLSSKEKKCLALIRDQVSPNFEIVQGYFDEYPLSEGHTEMVGSIDTTLRLVLHNETFKNCEFSYIGDVNLLIIRETPSLINGHKKHSNKIGVPYSNTIRAHSKRLTGLHFIKVKDYYQK